MKLRTAAYLLAVAGLTTGCAGGMNADGLMSGAGKMFSAYNLSDAEVKTLSDQACAESDKTNKVAAPGSKYDRRLQKIAKPLGNESLNGVPPNFKVYQVPEVNAWAMANGCIRVYAGLMDKMTDAEVQGVLAHEMGHVSLGHSRSSMQTAYTVSAARELAAASGNATVTALSSSQAGDLAEKFINAQYSQSQESAADDYAYDTLKARKLRTAALVSAFNKLAAMDGGASTSMLSSHPGSSDRAKRIQARIDADKKK